MNKNVDVVQSPNVMIGISTGPRSTFAINIIKKLKNGGRQVWEAAKEKRLKIYKQKQKERLTAKHALQEYSASLCSQHRPVPILLAIQKFREETGSSSSSASISRRLRVNPYPDILKVYKPKRRWLCCGNVLEKINFQKYEKLCARSQQLKFEECKLKERWMEIILWWSFFVHLWRIYFVKAETIVGDYWLLMCQ